MSKDPGGARGENPVSNSEAWDYFLNGPREVFTCEFCGEEAHRGNPPHMRGALYAEVGNDPAIVCDRCNESYEWETIEARIRKRRGGPPRFPIEPLVGAFHSLIHPISRWIPIPLTAGEIPPEKRQTLRAEQLIFVGRLGTFLSLLTLVLVGIAIFAGLVGALFVSAATGLGWFFSTLGLYMDGILFLATRPVLAFGIVGLVYLIHLVDLKRHLEEPERTPSRSRPRWQYLAVASGIDVVGWAFWVLSQTPVFPSATLGVGVLTWSAGTFVVVYLLHYTLQEDRWSYGLRVQGALWKFPAQFALGLMLYDGVLGLPGSNTVSYGVAIVPPLVGLLYVTRRQLAFTERGARFGSLVESSKRRWRQWMPAIPGWIHPEVEASQPTSQFGAVTESARTDSPETGHASRSRDPDEELRQANEWASYLESELHDREEQLQDLEARLARVRQKLDEDQQTDTESDDVDRREREDLLTDLFDIRDNFRRALDAEDILEDDTAGDFREGIELIDRQIGAMIEREGVSEIDTSGEVDPGRHRVVGTVPDPDHEAGEIVEVYRLGYRDGDRVLREADVVVAEESTEQEDPDAGNWGPSRDDASSNRDRSVNHGDGPT